MTKSSADASFKNHLKGRCGTDKCPFCGHSDWLVRTNRNGDPASNKILTHEFVNEISSAITQATAMFDGLKSNQHDAPKSIDQEILNDVVIAQCTHCGFISFFSRKRMGYLDEQQ